MPVAHVAQVLDASLRGLPLAAAAGPVRLTPSGVLMPSLTSWTLTQSQVLAAQDSIAS